MACTFAVAALALLSGCDDSDHPLPPSLAPRPSLPAVADDIALAPRIDCTPAGIGTITLTADAPVTILEVGPG